MSGLHHPNRRHGENFVGNFVGETVPAELSHLKTARAEPLALDIHGKISPARHKALMIGDSDLAEYDRIKMAQVAAINRGWRG